MKKSKMDLKFNVKDIIVAELKYYSGNLGGIECMKPFSSVLVVKNGDEYINVLNLEESFQTYERAPYSNTTIDGESYGTKLFLAGGYPSDGPCWLLTRETGKNLFSSEEVTIREIEDYVLDSPIYFKDRYYVALSRLKRLEKPLDMLYIVLNEHEKKEKMERFLNYRDKAEMQFTKSRR